MERYILVPDIEEVGNLDVRNPCSKAQCKRSINVEDGEIVIFPIAEGNAQLFGRYHGVRQSTLRQDQLVRSEDIRGELKGNSERSQPTETKDDAESRNNFWSIEGDFIYRHHVERRVQFNVPKEETFPIPLRYIDVTRTTHTNLDVLQESRVDDYWKVDVDRSLSDSWTGFTKFTLPNDKLPQGYVWSGERLTKIQATTRPDFLWPEIWFGVSKAAKKKEKQEWTSDKPNLIMLENYEVLSSSIGKMESNKETIKNASDGGGYAL